MHLKLTGLAIVTMLAVTASMAMGPADGEVTALYWNVDYEATSDGANPETGDDSAVGLRAKLWFFGKWGVKGFTIKSEPVFGAVENDIKHTYLDFQRKLISPTENNYLAAGVGWNMIDFSQDGAGLDSSGFRLTTEARVGLGGIVYAYGEGAYYLSMDDASVEVEGYLTELVDIDGHEYELGIGFEPFPFLTVQAGYRFQTLDYEIISDGISEGSETLDSDGFIVAAGIHF